MSAKPTFAPGRGEAIRSRVMICVHAFAHLAIETVAWGTEPVGDREPAALPMDQAHPFDCQCISGPVRADWRRVVRNGHHRHTRAQAGGEGDVAGRRPLAGVAKRPVSATVRLAVEPIGAEASTNVCIDR